MVGVEESLARAKRNCWKHSTALCSKFVTLGKKFRHYQTYIVSVALSGCQYWHWCQALKQRLDAWENNILVLMGPVKRKVSKTGKLEHWVNWRRRAVHVNRRRYEKEGFRPLCDFFLQRLLNFAFTCSRPIYNTCNLILQGAISWKSTASWIALRECGVGSQKKDDSWKHAQRGRRPRSWEDVFVHAFGAMWMQTLVSAPIKQKWFVREFLREAFLFAQAQVKFWGAQARTWKRRTCEVGRRESCSRLLCSGVVSRM